MDRVWLKKPDDQLPKGWKYFHCDKCNKGEPVKIDEVTEEELSNIRYLSGFQMRDISND